MAEPNVVRDALAEYAEVESEQVGTYAIVYETKVDENSSLHTIWTNAPYMHHMGMLAELEHQIQQDRIRKEAEVAMRRMMDQAQNSG